MERPRTSSLHRSTDMHLIMMGLFVVIVSKTLSSRNDQSLTISGLTASEVVAVAPVGVQEESTPSPDTIDGLIDGFIDERGHEPGDEPGEGAEGDMDSDDDRADDLPPVDAP